MAMLAERIPARARRSNGGWSTVSSRDDELAAEAGALAERLASGPTLSYAASKRLLNAASMPDLAEQLDREAVAQQAQAESEDFTIGVLAFLAKQEPEFKGR